MAIGRLYQALLTVSPPRDRAALLAFVQAGVRAGAISAEIGTYLKATLESTDLRLRNAMVPRVDVVAIAESCSAAEAARRMAESGRRRLPVYHETIDQPIGVVHALDVARALATHGSSSQALPTAGKLARPTLTVPETLPLMDALQAMRSQAVHLLLVLDERGGLAGLATLEDILEQIVGPIPDEYGDEGRDAIRVVGSGEAIVGAAAGVHEVERILNIRLPNGRVASIGGLVYEYLGHVPRPGDVVELPGARIEVLSMDGVRLNELRVRTGAALAEAPDAPEERRLELRIGREVMCGHDLVGRLERLVVDPISGRVHQLVVRHAQRPLLIGLDLVEREDDGVIYLDPHACDVERLPSYDPTRFVLRGDVAYALGGSLEELKALRRARQGTTGGPAGVEVTRGTEVVATDGRIGRVRHVLLDRTSGAVTHVVVRREPVPLITLGDVVVPLSWARSIRPERIELAVSRAELAELPEFRTDEEIEAEVLRRFAADARFAGIDRYTLNVSVDGGVVRLKGRARSVELKRAAEELARTTPGVLAVDNEVIADDELAAEVERALRADPRLHFEELEVLVLLGQVKLRGRVPTPDERRHAGELARHVAGVESVVNQLGVAPA